MEKGTLGFKHGICHVILTLEKCEGYLLRTMANPVPQIYWMARKDEGMGILLPSSHEGTRGVQMGTEPQPSL
jgi:hypothetical protein